MISGIKNYFPQVPCESAAKSKRNKPVNPTLALEVKQVIQLIRGYLFMSMFGLERCLITIYVYKIA